MGAKDWRMLVACADCPFNRTGSGAILRRTLRRWPRILADLRARKHFLCHKTTRATGDGSRKVCAGAIAYQARHRCVSQYQQVCERLEWFAAERRRRAAQAGQEGGA